MIRSPALGLLLLATLAWSHPAATQVGRQPGMLDPNVATERELQTVPHLTPALVRQILERRPFLSMADFHALVSQSLTPEQTQQVYRTVFVHLNLNTATREEILLIPGVGSRMLREFLEYRPYRNLAQFRREIGKYVDAKEVARLERYVTIN
jgi:DNA uptake protein ComE-like DNA-binding protein